MIKIKENENNKIEVYTPYNREFVSKVKKISSAKWSYNKGCWEMDKIEIGVVRKFMMDCYGENDIEFAEKVDVKVKFLQTVEVYYKGIELFGRTIAYAFGRDSGAKLGDKVTCLDGEYSSGGSMKNWKTIIDEGAEFIIRDVAKNTITEYDKEIFEIEINEKSNSNEDKIVELEEQKKELQKKIKKINEQLRKLKKEQ